MSTRALRADRLSGCSSTLRVDFAGGICLAGFSRMVVELITPRLFPTALKVLQKKIVLVFAFRVVVDCWTAVSDDR